jgi:two-component system CheB/CheR fusion protein
VKRNLSAKKELGARKRQSDAKSAITASNWAQLEQDRLIAELETLRQAQIEFDHSQQLYAELFDLAPVGYLNLTPKGKVENANLAACALLGKQRSQVVGSSFFSFISAPDQRKLADHLLKCQTSEAGDTATELRLFAKNAKDHRYVELLSRRSMLFGTTKILYRTVVRDITDRRQAEDALRASEERTRVLSANLPGGAAFIVDRNLRCLLAGGEALAVLASGTRDFVGRTLRDILKPELAAAYIPFFRKLLLGAPSYQEHIIEERTFLSWGVPLRDADSSIYAVLAVSYDITERKRAEQALQKSEETLRLMIESAHEYAIFTTDLDMRVTTWNPGAERLLGFAESEILGSSANVIFTPEDRANRRPEVERDQALSEGRASDQRWHLRKDGARFWSNGFLMPMHESSGKVVGFVKILRDDTETRQAQEALERSRQELVDALEEKERAWKEAETASKAKDHFVAVLSHELRTPLTPVLLVSQMLSQRKDLPPDVAEALEMIANNVQIEARFIDDLLDMTRLARGKLELAREIVDVHEVLKRAIEVSRGDIEGRQQKLAVSLRAKRHTVTGDRTRLQQVFWNLLKNASKFTPKGGKIRVVSRDNGDRIAAIFSDNGIGIEPDALPMIFNSFTQGSKEVTKEFGGLGLGLAISQATVDAHNGTLRAKSRGQNKGATFIVELPLEPAANT